MDEQTSGVATFDVRCDADRHWRPVLPHNPYPDTPAMPSCIGKNISCQQNIILYFEVQYFQKLPSITVRSVHKKHNRLVHLL